MAFLLFLRFFVRCMECDRPSLNPLEFSGKFFLPLVILRVSEYTIYQSAVHYELVKVCIITFP